jgi:hypothetical protein
VEVDLGNEPQGAAAVSGIPAVRDQFRVCGQVLGDARRASSR